MDSSAYLKLFVAEVGSQEMIDFFMRSEDRTLLVSVLAAVEVRSAIRRRQYAADIPEDQATLAISTLVQETGRLTEHPITAAVIAEAVGLVDRYGLRSLDSIQLATALIRREVAGLQQGPLFVSADHKLLKAADAEHLITWNPAMGVFRPM